MKSLLPILLFAACDNSWGPGAQITATGDDPRWHHQVELAADAWNDALHLCGPVLYVIPSGGHPVSLVDGSDWDEDLAGHFDGEKIEVRIGLRSVEYPILLHELGHGLGLGHVDVETDPDSIMNPWVDFAQRISERDIRLAVDKFNCGGE